MKNTLLLSTLFVTAAAVAGSVKEQNVYYSSGHYLAGEVIPLGNDSFGYNYNAHKFSGSYFNAYAGGAGLPPYNGDDGSYLADNPSAQSHWAWPYRNVDISIKWNDMWLSNQDNDGDDRLDRHYGYTSYRDSGAWEIYQDSYVTTMTDSKGREKSVHQNSMVKIIAAPDTAYQVDGVWFSQDGVEIGPVIWGEFAVVQEVVSGPGASGKEYVSPNNAGLGHK